MKEHMFSSVLCVSVPQVPSMEPGTQLIVHYLLNEATVAGVKITQIFYRNCDISRVVIL